MRAGFSPTSEPRDTIGLTSSVEVVVSTNRARMLVRFASAALMRACSVSNGSWPPGAWLPVSASRAASAQATRAIGRRLRASIVVRGVQESGIRSGGLT